MPNKIFPAGDSSLYEILTKAEGPKGTLPLTADMLRNRPSGDIFGWTQAAGMGWDPSKLGSKEFLILSTQGGIRAPDGRPIALGYHTGHYEVGLLMQEAAVELTSQGAIPFAGFCSDPCDGRTQGTTGMMDSLPYRNDAAQVLRRLIRSLPTRRGVIGVATCDKGLPAMMIALASMSDLPTVLVPGGVTLPASDGEDAGKVQSIGARFSHGELTLGEAQELGCRACGSPGGGCQFLGTAATSQVVSEALGLSLPHTALAPSGQPIWKDAARRSARAIMEMESSGLTTRKIVTDDAVRNAMTVHAAFGGSTNLLLHLPAVAYAAGLHRPGVDDWTEVNRSTPRLVDVLPNERAICSTEFLVLKARPPFQSSYVYCLTLSPFFRQQIESIVTGTSGSHQRAPADAVLSLQAFIPPTRVIEAFVMSVSGLFRASMIHHRESFTLAAQRDELLPKLVSGEVQVEPLRSVL